MSTKVVSVRITKETLRQLQELKKYLGEGTSQVINRGIQNLHYSLPRLSPIHPTEDLHKED